MTNPISRKGMQKEIDRLKAENRKLLDGGRTGAAASLIVSDLFKIAHEHGMEQGVTGQQFIDWWRKVLEPETISLGAKGELWGARLNDED